MVQSRAGAGGTVQIALRLPEGLRDRIKAAADEAGQSMNSAIVTALEEKYPEPPGLTMADIDVLAKQIIATPEGPEQLALLKRANDALSADPHWQGWRLVFVMATPGLPKRRPGLALRPPSEAPDP